MHQMRLTLSKHHGMQTRNCLKRLFVEQCRLQSLKTKLMKIYSRVQKIYRKIKRLANFRDCIKWGWLEANIMEPKLETIWSGVFWTMWLTVTQTKLTKMFLYIRVGKTSREMRRPDSFRKCIKWGWLWANIMEYKLETVWSGCLLKDAAYSNSKRNEEL